MNKNPMEEGTPPPINDFEKVIAERGYTFLKEVNIAGRLIQVYEKPPNPKYVITRKASPSDLEDNIFDLVEVLERDWVLVDGFDKNHVARHAWFSNLGSDDLVTYNQLKKRSKLRDNPLNVLVTILSDRVMGKEITNPDLLRRFQELSQEFQSSLNSAKYFNSSLAEKILYMEEKDEIIMRILDLLMEDDEIRILFEGQEK